MKALGVVRRVDPLGRIVIPREIYKVVWKLKVTDKPMVAISEFEDGILVEANKEDGAYIGIARQVDNLGRIVVPMETRRKLKLQENDAVEFFIFDDKSIYIKPYAPGCIFCGELDGTIYFEGRHVCLKCIKELTKVAG